MIELVRRRPTAARSSRRQCRSRPRASTTSWPRSRRASRPRRSRPRPRRPPPRRRSRGAPQRPSPPSRPPARRYAPRCREAHPRDRAGSDAARPRPARRARCARAACRSSRPTPGRATSTGCGAGDFGGIVPLGGSMQAWDEERAAVPRPRSASSCARPSTRACRCSASAWAASCWRARSAPRCGRPSGPRRAGSTIEATPEAAGDAAARAPARARRRLPVAHRRLRPARRVRCASRAASRARTRPSATASARGACSSTPRSTPRSSRAGCRTTPDAPARVGLDRAALEAAIAAGSPEFTDAALRSVLLRLRRAAAASAARVALAPVGAGAPGVRAAAVDAVAERRAPGVRRRARVR